MKNNKKNHSSIVDILKHRAEFETDSCAFYFLINDKVGKDTIEHSADQSAHHLIMTYGSFNVVTGLF